jgi:hypothetical protein
LGPPHKTRILSLPCETACGRAEHDSMTLPGSSSHVPVQSSYPSVTTDGPEAAATEATLSLAGTGSYCDVLGSRFATVAIFGDWIEFQTAFPRSTPAVFAVAGGDGGGGTVCAGAAESAAAGIVLEGSTRIAAEAKFGVEMVEVGCEGDAAATSGDGSPLDFSYCSCLEGAGSSTSAVIQRPRL